MKGGAGLKSDKVMPVSPVGGKWMMKLGPGRKRSIMKLTGTFLVIGLLLGLVFIVQAAGLTYDLLWWTVDGGGGQGQGGVYELDDTTGQADAGALQGGSYSLAGGFWSAAPSAAGPITNHLMLPLVLKTGGK